MVADCEGRGGRDPGLRVNLCKEQFQISFDPVTIRIASDFVESFVPSMHATCHWGRVSRKENNEILWHISPHVACAQEARTTPYWVPQSLILHLNEYLALLRLAAYKDCSLLC
jgi:hypothetical protein